MFSKAFTKVVAVLSLSLSVSSLSLDEAAAADGVMLSSGPQNTTIVPGTYIVQLKSTGTGLGRRNFASHNEFFRLSKRADLTYTTRETFADSSLFVGLSLTLDSSSDLQALKDLDNVLEVWPVMTMPRPLAAISTSTTPKRYTHLEYCI